MLDYFYLSEKSRTSHQNARCNAAARPGKCKHARLLLEKITCIKTCRDERQRTHTHTHTCAHNRNRYSERVNIKPEKDEHEYKDIVLSALTKLCFHSARAYKKILSPPSLRVFTTDGKANHSGISSPDRRRFRNSVPESFAIFSPFSFAALSAV